MNTHRTPEISTQNIPPQESTAPLLGDESMSRRDFGKKLLGVLGGIYMLGQGHDVEAVETNIYGVNMHRLQEKLRTTGVLSLTHNGASEAENEFWRVAGDPRLGTIVEHIGGANLKKSKVIKKQCPLNKNTTGAGHNGADLTEGIGSIDWWIVDATGGVISPEAKRAIAGKKFGLIHCAGHIFDIEKLTTLSEQFHADESLLMLGGCRGAELVRKLHRPKRLVAGSFDGIGTEMFTQLTKVSAASIVGGQCGTWPEYFANLQRNYSLQMQRRPDVYMFPGNPRYPG